MKIDNCVIEILALVPYFFDFCNSGYAPFTEACLDCQDKIIRSYLILIFFYAQNSSASKAYMDVQGYI